MSGEGILPTTSPSLFVWQRTNEKGGKQRGGKPDEDAIENRTTPSSSLQQASPHLLGYFSTAALERSWWPWGERRTVRER